GTGVAVSSDGTQITAGFPAKLAIGPVAVLVTNPASGIDDNNNAMLLPGDTGDGLFDFAAPDPYRSTATLVTDSGLTDGDGNALVNAGAAGAVTVNVTLLDYFGQPVPGVQVALNQTKGPAGATPGSGMSGADGTVSLTIAATYAGTYAFTLVDAADGVTL